MGKSGWCLKNEYAFAIYFQGLYMGSSTFFLICFPHCTAKRLRIQQLQPTEDA